MLADEGDDAAAAGELRPALHLPAESISAIISFIAVILPAWRDDPIRPAVTQETKLTAQLCARLNSASRHSAWDFLQFRQEEPDSIAGGRTVDLVVAPAGAIFAIQGRTYSEYQTIIPIECKRLPTPTAADRDPREYLYSRFSTTGGVDRFKQGHHGADHFQAAMVGYIQDKDVTHWRWQFDAWVDEIAAAGASMWTVSDKFALLDHDPSKKTARLQSVHARVSPLDKIALDHLWVEL